MHYNAHARQIKKSQAQCRFLRNLCVCLTDMQRNFAARKTPLQGYYDSERGLQKYLAGYPLNLDT